MSRKKTQPKKNIVPDPKYNSTIIPKLINNILPFYYPALFITRQLLLIIFSI